MDLRPEFTPRPEYQVHPASLPELVFRHSGWMHQRRQVFNAMQACGVSANRLDAFANCGSALTLRRNQETGRYIVGSNHCHDRHCVPCAHARSWKIVAAVTEHLKGRRVLFVTLTRKHNTRPLSDQIDDLYRCWNLLRRRPFFRDAVAGGAAFLEIHRSTATGCWHPHLHILAEARWIDQSILSREWLSVTTDSEIVDVRLARTDSEIASYVAKYASKPANKVIYDDPDSLQEMIRSLSGRRLAATFGSWRGLKLKPDAPADEQGKSLGFVVDLFREAALHDRTAMNVLQELHSQQPNLFENLASVFYPQFVFDSEAPP